MIIGHQRSIITSVPTTTTTTRLTPLEENIELNHNDAMRSKYVILYGDNPAFFLQ